MGHTTVILYQILRHTSFILTGNFDVSKIPDIYDNIKYDLQHNSSILETSVAERLYILSKALADIVIPQVQYSINSPICSAL